ncbi:MAG: hypothetical protein R3D31_17515 [Hyphomicrobiaceae bacterium]
MASIADGIYEATAGTIKLLSGPDITLEIISKFQELLKHAHETNLSISELEQEAQKIHPKCGEVIRNAKKTTTTALLLIALIVLGNCKINVSVDANRLIDQIIGKPPQSLVEGWRTSVRRDDPQQKQSGGGSDAAN